MDINPYAIPIYMLMHLNRTTTGGGNPSSSAVAALSGSSYFVDGSISPNFAFKALSPAYFSSVIAS